MFDLGVVLMHLEYDAAREACLALCDPARVHRSRDFLNVLGRSPIVDAYERGELSARAFFDHFVAHTGFSGSFETFVAIWRSIFRENAPMIEFGRRVAERWPVFFMTNASDLHVPWIFERFPSLNFFTDVACSCYIGAAKPDPTYYTRALAKFGVDAASSLFVDDRPENIEAARALGFRGVLYESPEQAIAEMRALLNWA
jgi:FMN phosphatase YigB (HAD superfamily)